jgi:chromosome segregation protein
MGEPLEMLEKNEDNLDNYKHSVEKKIKSEYRKQKKIQEKSEGMFKKLKNIIQTIYTIIKFAIKGDIIYHDEVKEIVKEEKSGEKWKRLKTEHKRWLDRKNEKFNLKKEVKRIKEEKEELKKEVADNRKEIIKAKDLFDQLWNFSKNKETELIDSKVEIEEVNERLKNTEEDLIRLKKVNELEKEKDKRNKEYVMEELKNKDDKINKLIEVNEVNKEKYEKAKDAIMKELKNKDDKINEIRKRFEKPLEARVNNLEKKNEEQGYETEEDLEVITMRVQKKLRRFKNKIEK